MCEGWSRRRRSGRAPPPRDASPPRSPSPAPAGRREHRADGDEDHSTAPQKCGPSGRARCSHWVSQTSATRRACSPEVDSRSTLAIEFDPDRPAAGEPPGQRQRDKSRRRAGGHYHLGPLLQQDARRPAAPAARRRADCAGWRRGSGSSAGRRAPPATRVDADVDGLEALEGGHDAAELRPSARRRRRPPAAAAATRSRGGRAGAPGRRSAAASRLPRRRPPRRCGRRRSPSPSATWMPGRPRSQPTVSTWWSEVCSPSLRRRGSTTTGRPRVRAVTTDPTPAWATTSRARRTVSSNAPRSSRRCQRMCEGSKPPSPIWASASSSGCAADQASIARTSRSKGSIEPMVTKITALRPSSEGPPGRARCSHWVSQTSATRRASRPDIDLRGSWPTASPSAAATASQSGTESPAGSPASLVKERGAASSSSLTPSRISPVALSRSSIPVAAAGLPRARATATTSGHAAKR